MLSSRPYTFDRVVRIIFTLVILAAVFWVLSSLSGVLLPFLVACLVAYIFEPFVQYNRQTLHLKGRTVAVLATLFEITTFVVILAYIFVPSIGDEIHQVAALLRRYASSDVDIPLLPDSLHRMLRHHINFNDLASRLTERDLGDLLNSSVSFISGGVGVLMSVLEWMLVFIYVLFIMLDYDNLMRGFRMLVPQKYRRTMFGIGNDIKRSMNHYFRGQALIASIVAVLYAVGFSLVGIPLSVLVGLVTGALFMIPYVQYITVIPVTLLCIVYSVDSDKDFWTLWWECVLVYVVAQSVADLILTPKIMGKAMGLNPAIILLSLSVWGSLLGLIGLIIALPLTTLLLSYYNNYLTNRERRTHDRSASLLERIVSNPFDETGN